MKTLKDNPTYKYWYQFTQELFEREWVIIALLIVLTFVLRLKGLTNTPTDWHAFRQADTASVTREYVKHGIDLLHPHYQDLSNIQSGKENLEGYRMVEFPVVNALVAFIVRSVPGSDLVVTSRLISILFSVGTMVALYYLGKRWSGQDVGIAAAVVFAVLPYARFYSRAILPEAPFIFFVTASIVWFDCWLEQRRWPFYFLSALTLAAALLLKPFALFLGPVYALLALQKYRFTFWKRLELLPFALLAFAPLIWWRRWIQQFPSGIPASDWLFNGDGIRFRPAWFRWLFFERITKLIMGWVGVVFLVAGVWPKNWTNWLRLATWWLCILAYFSVIATGNVRHDYYQVFILPILCLTAGFGMSHLLYLQVPKTTVWLRLLLVLLVLGGAVKLSWRYIEGYYSTRPDWETAGRAVDRLVPADAKVIAPAFGDTAFLFQTNRTGWPIGYYIDKKIEMGAQYYVTTAYDDEAHELEAKYKTLEKNDKYLILDLQSPISTPSSTR